tara:strand:+ start:197 stop:418 length:222 start_codon:yes stop_codon:yes gene_type:complete
MSKVDNYRKQITADMDQLQACMEAQMHLNNPATVLKQLDSIKLRWNFVSEEDQDYVHGCEHALEEGIEWNANH